MSAKNVANQLEDQAELVAEYADRVEQSIESYQIALARAREDAARAARRAP